MHEIHFVSFTGVYVVPKLKLFAKLVLISFAQILSQNL